METAAAASTVVLSMDIVLLFVVDLGDKKTVVDALKDTAVAVLVDIAVVLVEIVQLEFAQEDIVPLKTAAAVAAGPLMDIVQETAVTVL